MKMTWKCYGGRGKGFYHPQTNQTHQLKLQIVNDHI
jgi:hypothetical protein